MAPKKKAPTAVGSKGDVLAAEVAKAPKPAGKGAPPDSAVVQDLKKKAHKDVKPAFVPYGQDTTWPADRVLRARVIALQKQWPLKKDGTAAIHSFEAWCGMTRFDPNFEDGGEQFQKLMQWLLTMYQQAASGQPKGWQVDLKGTYYNAQKTGAARYTGTWAKLPALLNEWRYFDKTSGYYIHSGKSQSQWGGMKGAPQGANSGALTGFTYEGWSKEGTEVSVSRLPGSRLQWLQAFGVSQKFEGNVSHTTDAQFTSRGYYSGGGAAGNCEEHQGCMASGNNLAAIFGLYFYKGCNLPKYNWVVHQQVNGRDYYIRMRLPNPAFEFTASTDDKLGNLWVLEELNPDARDDRKLGTVGGETPENTKKGFRFPVSFNLEQGSPILPWNHIRDSSNVTRLAPYFGDAPKRSEDQGVFAKRAVMYREMLRKLHTELGDVVHKPEAAEANGDDAGLMFGFNLSAAMWLYPHWVPPHSTEVKGLVDKVPDDAEAIGYQPWPKWKPIYNTRAKRVAALAGTHHVHHIWELLDYNAIPHATEPTFTVEEIIERREYALSMGGVAKAAPATKHGPPDVQSVPVATDTVLADTEDTEERQPHQAVGANVPSEMPNKAGVEDPEVLEYDDLEDQVSQQGLEIGFGRADQIGVTTTEQMLDENLLEDALVEERLAGGQRPNVKKMLFEAANVPIGDELRALEEGVAGKPLDRNTHFMSSHSQPWSHADIYDESGTKIVPGRRMGDAAMDQYVEKYGSIHNLYLGQETIPKEIKRVEVNYGFAKEVDGKCILDHAITYQPKDKQMAKIFQDNLKRILVIYFDKSDIGDNRVQIAAINKKVGMLTGVYAPSKQSQQRYVAPSYGPKNRLVEIWKPVFLSTPPEDWAKCFDLALLRGDDSRLLKCMKDLDIDLYEEIDSEMTVGEWITTPWHYAYLPYQKQNAVFRDGETYSEGCNRCSRPFYEFEHQYAAFHLSLPGTTHWPTAYWQVHDSSCEQQCAKAPVPFHDPRFWKGREAKSRERTTEGVGEVAPPPGDIVDEDGGWHNWKTFNFVPIKYDGSGKDQWPNYKGLLKRELTKRLGMQTKNKPFLVKLNSFWREGKLFLFRQVHNHVWDADRKNVQSRRFPQGRLMLGNSKVKYGQVGYMLQRSSKYGNCCKDCAAVLEMAPGLYVRNHRQIFDAGLVIGNEEQQAVHGNAWWTNLIGRMDKEAAQIKKKTGKDMPNFDPEFLHMKPKTEAEREAFDESMAIMAKFLQKSHGKMPGKNTRVYNPPDIYIQKAVKEPEKDSEHIAEAIRTLRKLLQWHEHTRSAQKHADFDGKAVDAPTPVPKPILKSSEFGNPAFRDMVYELERKYLHKDMFTRDKTTTKVFDADMVRIEDRNVVAEDEFGDKFYNCLRVRTYMPKKGVQISKAQMPALGPDDYDEVTYLATRQGPNGEIDTNGPETQWAGDGYVTKFPEGGGDTDYWIPDPNIKIPMRQHRKLRQSRLFITYSLHRPVTSELEARMVMEKMADAAHELFGNDKYLSELLVFGYKLDGFMKSKMPADTVSKAYFKVIDKPNKKDAVKDFYGGEGMGSSYIYDTYETHVDKVDVDGGIEIGPNMHHPHFHILLTVNHWSYCQIDYFKMNSYLELMFRGLDPYGFEWGERFKLVDASGGLFYTDNENPYVDIKLYPQDNWQDVIAAYVRKNAIPSQMEAMGVRSGPIGKEKGKGSSPGGRGGSPGGRGGSPGGRGIGAGGRGN